MIVFRSASDGITFHDWIAGFGIWSEVWAHASARTYQQLSSLEGLRWLCKCYSERQWDPFLSLTSKYNFQDLPPDLRRKEKQIWRSPFSLYRYSIWHLLGIANEASPNEVKRVSSFERDYYLKKVQKCSFRENKFSFALLMLGCNTAVAHQCNTWPYDLAPLDEISKDARICNLLWGNISLMTPDWQMAFLLLCQSAAIRCSIQYCYSIERLRKGSCINSFQKQTWVTGQVCVGNSTSSKLRLNFSPQLSGTLILDCNLTTNSTTYNARALLQVSSGSTDPKQLQLLGPGTVGGLAEQSTSFYAKTLDYRGNPSVSN